MGRVEKVGDPLRLTISKNLPLFLKTLVFKGQGYNILQSKVGKARFVII